MIQTENVKVQDKKMGVGVGDGAEKGLRERTLVINSEG